MANTTGQKFGGREKGTPNKITNDIREAYKTLIDKNIDNLDKWLNDIAKESPARAFDILLKLSEFIIPKLNKQNIDISEQQNTEITIITDEETKKDLEDIMRIESLTDDDIDKEIK